MSLDLVHSHREGFPNWLDHTKVIMLAIEQNFISIGTDIDLICDSKHGLDTDAFLTNGLAFSLSLGASGDTAERLDVFVGEALLVAGDEKVVGSQMKFDRRQCRWTVSAVVGILNYLPDKMVVERIQLVGKAKGGQQQLFTVDSCLR